MSLHTHSGKLFFHPSLRSSTNLKTSLENKAHISTVAVVDILQEIIFANVLIEITQVSGDEQVVNCHQTIFICGSLKVISQASFARDSAESFSIRLGRHRF